MDQGFPGELFVATYLVTHTFDITMAIFDLAQHVVHQSAGVITGETLINFETALGSLTSQLETMEIGELFGLLVETVLLKAAVPPVYLYHAGAGGAHD